MKNFTRWPPRQALRAIATAKTSYKLIEHFDGPSSPNDRFELQETTNLGSGVYRAVFTDVIVNKDTFFVALWDSSDGIPHELISNSVIVHAEEYGPGGQYILNATVYLEVDELHLGGDFYIHFDEDWGDPSIASGEADLEYFDVHETFNWDFRNRLTQAKKYTKYTNPHSTDSVELTFPSIVGARTFYLSESQDYVYDVLDQLIATTSYNENHQDRPFIEKRTFVNERGHRVLEQVDRASGDDSAQRRLYGQAVDMPLAVDVHTVPEQGAAYGATIWTLTDHQGTVQALYSAHWPTESHSSQLDRIDYTPFGAPSGAITSMWLDVSTFYAGRELDRFTGLYNNRARWYDAGAGRFISEDPIGLAAQDTNLYRYVFNNPLSFTDPSGQVIPLIAWAGFALAGVGVGIANYYANELDIATGGTGYIPGLREDHGIMHEFDAARYNHALTGYGIGLGITAAGFGLAAAPAIIPGAANALWVGGVSSASAAHGLATTGYVAASAQAAIGLVGSGPRLATAHPALQLAGIASVPLAGAFGAFIPYGGIGSLGGSLATGAGFAATGNDFWTGYDIGGVGGGIGGGFAQAAIRQASLRAALWSGTRAALPEATGGAIGFGAGFAATGNIQGGWRYANYGMFIGGVAPTALRGVGRRSLRWHREMNDAYTYGAPPGGHWSQGVGYRTARARGIVGTPEQLHHWLIPQRAPVSNYIKNRSWNLKTMADRAAHARVDTAFTVTGVRPYHILIRPWMAMPNWARIVVLAGSVSAAYAIDEVFFDDV